MNKFTKINAEVTVKLMLDSVLDERAYRNNGTSAISV